MLGIGFQERGEAGDFVDCLRRVGRVMGWGGDNDGKGGGGDQGRGKGKGGGKEKEKMKDWSLKEGEMIRVEINGVGDKGDGGRIGKDLDGDAEALFSIKPPPSGGDGGGGAGMPFLPPPPSARDVKAERRRSRGRVEPEEGSAAELGFDDGEFGEFQ